MTERGAFSWDKQDWLSEGSIFLFSVSVGMATVLVPLVADDAGYSLAAIGFFVAVSAVFQLLARMGMGVLIDRFATKTLIVVALVMMLVSCAMLATSSVLWVFLVSQVLHGAARAYFFTGSQIHVVRNTNRKPVKSVALMNVTNGAGMLAGPILAGVIGEFSLQAAMWVAAIAAGIGVPASMVLAHHAPFPRPPLDPDAEPERPVWMRPGVVAAGLMGVTAGTWRGILSSYVPVLLTAAGHSLALTGILGTVANLAALIGSSVAHQVRRLGVRRSAVTATMITVVSLVMLTFVTQSIWLAATFLFLSGIGAGLLQTFQPTLAAEAVGPEDQGRSIAAAGTYRAAALLLAPMGIGALVLILPSAGLATAVIAVLVGLPSVLVRPGRS
ncbi:MFS transporter [Microbacterium sp. MEC084]|uniref:MFS transporter n=1 Tax=unclassified Microbacterium TaxID=2609290 RepID=UPI0006F5E899|nr:MULTISPECIES: MFS transporter [unclassified Microbacterium]KQZ11761.1 hypothetical protein ASD19_00285 [Microbacterium sp. Root53]MCD1269358.1 MFS transporter [Microbacterium sp. MEC084]